MVKFSNIQTLTTTIPELSNMQPSERNTVSNTSDMERGFQEVGDGAGIRVRDDPSGRPPRYADEGKPRDLVPEPPALHRLRTHSATNSLPCVSTNAPRSDATSSRLSPPTASRLSFLPGILRGKLRKEKVSPSGTHMAPTFDQSPAIEMEKDKYSIKEAQEDAMTEQSQIRMPVSTCIEEEQEEFPSAFASTPSSFNALGGVSPLSTRSRSSSCSSFGDAISPPIFSSPSADWDHAPLASNSDLDIETNLPSRSELNSIPTLHPRVESTQTAIAWSCRAGNHHKCCGTRVLQEGSDAQQYKCCADRTSGKKPPRCCASFAGRPCERPRVSSTNSAPVSKPKKRRSWYFSSLSSFASVPGGSKRSKGIFQRPRAPTPSVCRDEFEAHPIISSATDPNYLKETLVSALHAPVAGGSSSGTHHRPNTQTSFVDEEFEPQPIICPAKLSDLLKEARVPVSRTPTPPYTPTTDSSRPLRELTHARSNTALKVIQRSRSTPLMGSPQRDERAEEDLSRDACQITEGSASEVLETKGINLETDDMRGNPLLLAIDSVGPDTLGAHSETGPHIAQDAKVPAARDMITGAMSATEILRSLASHGCRDISEDLDFSEVTDYPVASGGFGDVYCATLHNGDRVGLKCIRVLVGPTAEGKKFLKHAAHELYIWSKCSHPNILELSGVMIFRERIAMVSPWVENNHLRWFLARGLQVDRCALCVQIVDGVDYLHGQGIVHGDLKPENILISEDHTPKLTDFGNAALAEYTLNFTNTSAAQSISARWTAPEILKQESKTTRAGDIFALGMIIFEAMTGLLPYAGSSDPVVMFSIAAGKLPDRPQAHIPIGVEQADRLWSVLTSCWAYDPNERPKAQKVRNMIEEITPGGLLNEADPPGC